LILIVRRYDGPYTGKRELAGCGGGQLGIAQQPALQQQQLAGNWSATSSSAAAHDNQQLLLSSSTGKLAGSAAASCLDAAGAAAEGVVLAMLPLGAWSAVELTPEGRLRHAEAGVVLEGAGERLVSVRQYSEEVVEGEVATVGLMLQHKQ
jgi:hypothetical protein